MFPDAVAHGPIDEVFTDVFFVTGRMETTFDEFPGVDWSFNRNMIIVREGDQLTLINSVRLSDEGLAELEALGTVAHLVRIGALHTRDDEFYVDRYHPTYWTMPGIEPEGITVDHRLTADGPTPFDECTVFEFATTNLPEGILIIERDGGIAVACDALQNWTEPDHHFTPETAALMTELGFFQPANIGPLFMMRSQPEQSDYDRLMQHAFRHALCGHGDPLRDAAHELYGATFARTYGA